MKSIRAYPLLLRYGYDRSPVPGNDFQDKENLFHWPYNLIENVPIWSRSVPNYSGLVTDIRRSYIDEES